MECSFDTSHEFFWREALKLKALSPRIMKKTHFSKKKHFFQNHPQGSLQAVLKNAPNCFCQKSEIDRLATRNSGKLSEKSAVVTYYAIYGTQQKNLPFSGRVWLKVWKRKTFFLWKHCFLKIFLWVHPTEIWPPHQIFFDESPGKVWSNSEKHGKNYNYWKKFRFFQNDPQGS